MKTYRIHSVILVIVPFIIVLIGNWIWPQERLVLIVFLYAIGVSESIVLYRGFERGYMEFSNGIAFRHKSPITFWLYAIGYGLIALVTTGVATLMVLD